MAVTARSSILLVLTIVACADSPEPATSTESIPIGDPVLVIGTDESRDGHVLHRVSDVERQGDGRVFIANSGSGEVRVFSPEGTLVGSFSGMGAGPGEHQYLARLWIAGDTLITFDAVAQKLSHWSLDGELLSESRLTEGRFDIRGRMGGGRFLSVSGDQSRFPQGTSRIDSSTVSLVAAGVTTLDIVTAPAQTRFAATLPDGGTIYTPLPLEPQLSVAANERQIVVGYGGDTIVSRYGPDGALLEQVSVRMRSASLSPEAKAAWQETVFDRVSAEERPEMERYLASLPYSADLPVFDRLLIDNEDRIWVRGFPVPGQDSVTWSVLGSDGNLESLVRAPFAADIRYVGDRHVVGILPRADGAEQVAVWRYPMAPLH